MANTSEFDSRNGDFLDLVQKDLNETEIELNENKIEKTPKTQWEKYVNLKVNEAAFEYLISQNNFKKNKKKYQVLNITNE